jgi:ATP-dependent exoDNAse (exonuclease V) alpha subunit
MQVENQEQPCETGSVVDGPIGYDDLSPDQAAAIDKLLDAIEKRRRVLVLSGPAGSGKSTLVAVLATLLRDDGWHVRYMASTGKAASRLQQILGEPVLTIHSMLYHSVNEHLDGRLSFGNAAQICDTHTVLFCDEASMVDVRLDQDIRKNLPRGAVLIYVGDRHQLPPVGADGGPGGWGPDFDHPDADLTEVHRQGRENPNLVVSGSLRLGGPLPAEDMPPWFLRRTGDMSTVAGWAVEELERGEDMALLVYTNDARQRLNRLLRQALGKRSQGEVADGERLVCSMNNKLVGCMNGETFVVHPLKTAAEVWPSAPLDEFGQRFLRVRLEGLPYASQTAWIHPDLIGANSRAFRAGLERCPWIDKDEALNVDYGYAITYHKSQGSQYRLVGLVLDDALRRLVKRDPATARRMVYTGYTRTRERVVAWVVR